MSDPRYYVVDDPITRSLGGTSTRFGIIDRTKLPLRGAWCHLWVTSSRRNAEIKAEALNNDPR